jgi:hypothetical protein
MSEHLVEPREVQDHEVGEGEERLEPSRMPMPSLPVAEELEVAEEVGARRGPRAPRASWTLLDFENPSSRPRAEHLPKHSGSVRIRSSISSPAQDSCEREGKH